MQHWPQRRLLPSRRFNVGSLYYSATSPAYYTDSMSVITFRATADVEQALVELAATQDRSQVIRDAILTAWRAKRREQLRAESAAVAADPDDRAEARAVLAEMESLRAW